MATILAAIATTVYAGVAFNLQAALSQLNLSPGSYTSPTVLAPVGLALPQRIGNWSLTSLQQRLVKTGGRLVRHACYYWLALAEGHPTQQRFGSMLRMIAGLPLPNG